MTKIGIKNMNGTGMLKNIREVTFSYGYFILLGAVILSLDLQSTPKKKQASNSSKFLQFLERTLDSILWNVPT